MLLSLNIIKCSVITHQSFKGNAPPKASDVNTVKDECGLQRRERMQRVEGAGCHGGDLVVIQREQADRAQPCEAVISHTAHPVAPQHPEKKGSAFFSLAWAGTRAESAAGVRAKNYDYKRAAASEGITSAVTPVLLVTSLKRLSAVCVEQAGRQRWVGE